jgi:hypothetical protein
MQSMFGYLMGLVALVVALNSCKPDKYAAENDLISTYYAQFPDSGSTAKVSSEFIEEKLLLNKILPDTTAATYQIALNYILNNNSTPFEASLLLAEELRPYLKNEPRLGLDSSVLGNLASKHPESKLALVLYKLSGQPFNDSVFLDNLLRGLTREDLQHPFYRNFALLSIAKMHERKAELWNREYAPSGNTIFITKNNTLTFVVDSAGKVRYDEKPISLEEVGRLTRLFMTQDSSKANWVVGRISLIGEQPINTGVIIIGISPNISNDDLLPVYEQINQVYTDKRKDAAQLFFKKDYFLLNKNERSALQLLTRKWISINELAPSPESL